VWRWVLSILLLASLSVGITAWLHPTVFAIDRDDLAQRWASLTAKYATAPATPAPAPAPAVVQAPVVEPAPVPEAPTPAAPAVTEEAAPPAPAPAQPIAGIIEPAAAALEDQAWVNAMPPGSFVVQHAAMPSFQAAAAWKKGVPALAKARIVAVYRPREKLAYFVVISGPFTTRAQANESNTVRGKPAGAWVRTTRSIRDQFNPEPVAAGQSQETPR
jgi:septal ring-binding cell division protein DamX